MLRHEVVVLPGLAVGLLLAIVGGPLDLDVVPLVDHVAATTPTPTIGVLLVACHQMLQEASLVHDARC
ncbi:hypothetical protein GUJ93_ZPchr0009g1836 [Zizania palustris]|uniref:Uncharacterized protein n=1 Tax=Zizania palustris TaxID=103762 RepID=A0A8J5RKP1_ZIZPA|nr:hypothetical protein GUJ93_ZPchr0009g1836 [Zizania palustris]